MRPIRLSDFTGGLSEVLAAEDFARDAVSKAKGFVLDTTVSVRSQWALRSFAGDDFVAIRGFSSDGNYLVGIKDDGTVWWTPAPDVDNAVTDLSWTEFTTVTAEPAYRFIGEVPIQASKQTVTNEIEGSAVDTDATLYGRNGLLINYNRVIGSGESYADPFVVFETGSGTLDVSVYTKSYPNMVPHPTISNFKIPDTDVMPRGNVGVVWGDRLVLADIQWFDQTGTDATLSDANALRYQNAMWFSEAGQVDTFDPLNVVVPCSSDARIVGLSVLDAGLLVMTTDASGRDGLILLRGTSGSFRIEVLRSRLAAPERLSDEHRNFADSWTETGSVAFIDSQGGVWQTNGLEVGRLDGPTLAPYGPADEDDHCASVGRWLFVSRGQRLLLMRSFGETGAWTELLVPSGRPMSMCRLGEALWFVVDGVPHRFAVGSSSTLRGTYNGSLLSGLTLATATLSVEQEGDVSHRRALWHRVGVRARGRGQARLDSVVVRPGPALESASSYTVSPAASVGPRFELVVQAGIGFAVEASTELSFTGDVEVESVSMWVSSGEPVR